MKSLNEPNQPKNLNQEITKFPFYDDLVVFVKDIAEREYTFPVLAAQAKILLGLPYPEFDPEMVIDRINWANGEDDEHGLATYLEALCVLYEDRPINYIVDRIEKEGLPEEWDDIVVSQLGHMDHPPTRSKRRAILEKIMLESQSPRTQYVALMGLAYVYEKDSIKALEALINGDSVESLKKDARQMLDGLHKSLQSVEAYAQTEHHKIIDQAIDIARKQIKGE